jgi:hypothetical protein
MAFERAGIEMPEPTYRLLTAEIGPRPDTGQVPTKRPAAESETAPESDEVQDVAATAEQELEQMVNEERAMTEEDDLLTRGDHPE